MTTTQSKDEKPRKRKPGAGRPSYEPNDLDRGKIQALNSVGFPHRQLALYMGTDIKTIKKHYPEEFENYTAEDKNIAVENALYYNAVHKLNVAAQIFWLKAHKHDVYGDKVNTADMDAQIGQSLLDSLADKLPD